MSDKDDAFLKDRILDDVFLKDRILDNGGVQVSIDTLAEGSIEDFIVTSLSEESTKKSNAKRVKEIESLVGE